ncbi:MAG: MerR family transcriptional regulator [Clostridiales bacterium]|jgi:DNA-binding transcriptional MerR regulator|nr:MerR family transcriptional regulator [Eubacteriales bacterium]MDH7567413.1 MerR family transcriptional regulator [Clostridiales bacterium]
MSGPFYKIEEVSVRTGLTKRTLRFYEDLELVSPIRTDAGYRLYSEDDIETIKKIVEIKEVRGFSLSEVKEVMELDKKLQNILCKKINDPDSVRSAIEQTRKQIEMIEEKEKKMERAKSKYKEILSKLTEIAVKHKEGG